MNNQILAIQLSESFSQLLRDLAVEHGLEITQQPAADAGELARAAAVLVVAGGIEPEATSHIEQAAASTSVPVAVIGSATDHTTVIPLVRSGAADYFALPGDVDRLRAWFEEAARRVGANDDAAQLTRQKRASYEDRKSTRLNSSH